MEKTVHEKKAHSGYQQICEAFLTVSRSFSDYFVWMHSQIYETFPEEYMDQFVEISSLKDRIQEQSHQEAPRIKIQKTQDGIKLLEQINSSIQELVNRMNNYNPFQDKLIDKDKTYIITERKISEIINTKLGYTDAHSDEKDYFDYPWPLKQQFDVYIKQSHVLNRFLIELNETAAIHGSSDQTPGGVEYKLELIYKSGKLNRGLVKRTIQKNRAYEYETFKVDYTNIFYDRAPEYLSVFDGLKKALEILEWRKGDLIYGYKAPKYKQKESFKMSIRLCEVLFKAGSEQLLEMKKELQSVKIKNKKLIKERIEIYKKISSSFFIVFDILTHYAKAFDDCNNTSNSTHLQIEDIDKILFDA
jgi:hypothetical protein